jgi:hypothetical protein
MIDKFHHLIHDEVVNEHFRWKSPIYKEDDLNGDGTFRNWSPNVDVNDPSNRLF